MREMKAYSVTLTNKSNPGLGGRRHDEQYTVATAIVIAASVPDASQKVERWRKENFDSSFYVEEIRIEDDTVIF
jgi:hypothetical protein